jgi:hypothetical protein
MLDCLAKFAMQMRAKGFPPQNRLVSLLATPNGVARAPGRSNESHIVRAARQTDEARFDTQYVKPCAVRRGARTSPINRVCTKCLLCPSRAFLPFGLQL